MKDQHLSFPKVRMNQTLSFVSGRAWYRVQGSSFYFISNFFFMCVPFQFGRIITEVGKMLDGAKFNVLNHNNNDNNYYAFTQDFYQKLNEGTNMFMESMQTSNAGGSVSMSVDNSSVGSSDALIGHPGLNSLRNNTYSPSVGQSVYRPGKITHRLDNDALAHALMDSMYPTEGLANYEEWTINLRNLRMGPPFAQGAFGKLYKGSYNGVDVAIKILERPENSLEKAQFMEQQFQQEVTMLANLKHPNIVRFIGACRKPMVWCIVTEYAKGGSVRQFLTKRQNRAVPLKTAVKQALDVARGMAYVHAHNFIHRDLKSDNLLISADKSIKIADFGVARIEVHTEGMTPETGTYRWMAPEMIQHRTYNQKVDVYSFGIVLWELITGQLPFQNMTAVQAAFAVVNRGVRPTIPNDCLPALTEIMTRCWDGNAQSLYLFYHFHQDSKRCHWITLRRGEKMITSTHDYQVEQRSCSLAGLLTSPHFPTFYSSGVSVGSEIYFPDHGWPFPSTKVRVLDTRSGTIRMVPSMKVARWAHKKAMGVVDGKIYVIGGTYGKNQVEVLDPETQTWEFAGEEKVQCNSRFSASLEDKVYMVDLEHGRISAYSPREGINNVATERLIEHMNCMCVVENVIYACFKRSGLMWFDTKLKVWRRLIDSGGKATLCSFNAGKMAEYEGTLAVFWTQINTNFVEKVDIRCRIIALDRVGEEIRGKIESSGSVATCSYSITLSHCLVVSD
ncbi:unnamed protein product [Brassica oleracea]